VMAKKKSKEEQRDEFTEKAFAHWDAAPPMDGTIPGMIAHVEAIARADSVDPVDALVHEAAEKCLSRLAEAQSELKAGREPTLDMIFGIAVAYTRLNLLTGPLGFELVRKQGSNTGVGKALANRHALRKREVEIRDGLVYD